MFSDITPGTLPAGTVTPFGTIRETSLTAYLVDTGTTPEAHALVWVAFQRIHGKPTPVMPLITFG